MGRLLFRGGVLAVLFLGCVRTVLYKKYKSSIPQADKESIAYSGVSDFLEENQD